MFKGKLEKFSTLLKFVDLHKFDFSKMDYININDEGNSLSGYCFYPVKKLGRKKFHITCKLGSRVYPFSFSTYIRPEIKTLDNGGKLFCRRDGTEIFNSEEDAMCWLLFHELYHFLRKTRQIAGQNTQAQANEYGFNKLREFKQWKTSSLQ